MPNPNRQYDALSPSVEVRLLGTVDFDTCHQLQQRLVYESTGRRDGQIELLLCEHPQILTVGRRGSRAHLFLDRQELISRRLEVRWVNHGGGCLPHVPGQLAVYPIVPLAAHGFGVGEYLERLQQGLIDTLSELGFKPETRPGQFGVWGRKGQLAALGVAVKDWTTYHGAFINVCPDLSLFRWIRTDPVGHSPMSSLLAEHQRPIRMTQVRQTVIRRLTAALGCERFHVYTGHPLLPRISALHREDQLRVG